MPADGLDSRIADYRHAVVQRHQPILVVVVKLCRLAGLGIPCNVFLYPSSLLSRCFHGSCRWPVLHSNVLYEIRPWAGSGGTDFACGHNVKYLHLPASARVVKSSPTECHNITGEIVLMFVPPYPSNRLHSSIPPMCLSGNPQLRFLFLLYLGHRLRQWSQRSYLLLKPWNGRHELIPGVRLVQRALRRRNARRISHLRPGWILRCTNDCLEAHRYG